jgi:hypothetical protein
MPFQRYLQRRKFMSRNRSLAAVSASLLVLITVILVVAPGAWAQSKYKTLYRFTGVADGDFPRDVIFDHSGNLYGAAGEGGSGPCSDGCGLIYKLTPTSDGSWTKSVLYSFCSLTNCADGFYPFSSLIFDQAGNLYGETYLGGGPVGCDCGVVFELIPSVDGSWSEKVLYHFTDGADGGLPIGGLIFDQASNLYGTTYGGTGYGVVFQLTPNSDGSWTENVLHSFQDRAGGAGPLAGVIFDQAGNLYGTTAFGGNINCGSGAGCGVVFELIPNGDGSWKEKLLHRFTNRAGGGFPGAGLIFDQAGNLYGTTEEGGNPSQCVGEGVGCGVIFELIPNADGSWKETVLQHFTGGKDGGLSFAGLIFDQAGNLYGTAAWGGNLNYCTGNGFSGGCGVVFKLVPNSKGGWNEIVLHRFVHDPGTHPVFGVIFGAGGNLYGTTQGDGVTTFGSVFEITP